jgi:uncharacterized protein (TIGR03067 family)
MLPRLCCALTVLALWSAPARVEERPSKRDKGARKDLQDLQGTWRLELFEDGKNSKIDLKKRTLFIGGALFLVREGEKVVQGGLLRVNPARKPPTIDVAVREGEHKDNTMLGIYQLKGDSLKVCFDPEGEGRPREFAAKKDSALFVASWKRVKPANQEIDIRGSYRCETFALNDKKSTLTAEIEKRGDAYLVKWQVSDGVAFLGAGIRRGGTLSVAWVNRGSAGVSVYKIEKGPRLVGVYTDVGGPGLLGREVLSPAKKPNEREARRR